MRMIWKSCSVASVFLGLEQFVYAWAVMILPSRSHMMMSRWDLPGGRRAEGKPILRCTDPNVLGT